MATLQEQLDCLGLTNVVMTEHWLSAESWLAEQREQTKGRSDISR